MTLSPERRDHLRAALLIACVVVLLFADVLILGKHFFIRDLTRYYYPTKKIVREVILSGEFPYWNRQYLAGQPMAANPEYEVFYPLQLLVLLPSYDFGYRLHILLHLILAGIGMYAFLRSLGARWESGVFGGVVFAVGGLIVSMVNLLPILFVIAWCPLIFLFARRTILQPNLRDASAAALLLGVQALAGEPTSLLQTWFLIGMYSFYRAWEARREGWIRIATPVSVAIALGLAGVVAGAAQLIPAAEHAAESARARPFDFSLVTAWSMPWARPLELIWPHVFGHIYEKGTHYWGSGLYPGTGSPFLFSIYGGILLAALLAGALAVRPRGSLFVIPLVLFSGILALGGHTPLFRFLYDAGIAKSVRYPEKWMFIGLFSLLVLGALMFDRLVEGDRRLVDAALGFTAAVTLAALALALFSLTDAYEQFFTRLWRVKNPRSAEWMAALSGRDWWVNAGRGAIACALLWGARAGAALRSRWWFGAVIVFVVADLAPVGFDSVPRLPKSFGAKPAIVDRLDARRDRYRIFPEADWYGSTPVAKNYFGAGEAVYWIVRNGLYPQTPASWGFAMALERDYDKTALLPTVDLEDAMWKVRDAGASWWRAQFMAMSNAWYYTEYRPYAEERERVGGKLARAMPLEFRKTGEPPRYYFADQIVPIRGPGDFIAKLKEKRWSDRVAFATSLRMEPAGGRVVWWGETANTARIDVEAEGRALLVMSVTPHQYWTATIDGDPAPLHVVNIGYQGIVVPPGRHRVEMRYRNTLVDASAAVSAAAFLLFGAVAIVTRRRRPGGEEAEATGVLAPAGSGPAPKASVAEARPEDVDEHPERVADDADPRIG
ncbi:MAG TPA: hypothetical protein VGF40_03500 [Thermoanaerobaculia bacterium]